MRKKDIFLFMWVGVVIIGMVFVTGCGNSWFGCDSLSFELEGEEVNYTTCHILGDTMAAACSTEDEDSFYGCDSFVNTNKAGTYLGYVDYASTDTKGFFCGDSCIGVEYFYGSLEGTSYNGKIGKGFGYVLPYYEVKSKYGDVQKKTSCLGLTEE